MLLNLTGNDALVVIIPSNNKDLQLLVLELLQSKGVYNTQDMQNIAYLIETLQEKKG